MKSFYGEDIERIGHHLRTQDNACTADPLFLVQQKRRVYGFDTQWADENIVWLCDSEECTAEESTNLEAAYQENGDEPDGFTRTAYVDEYGFVTCCLTRAAAELYIAQNGHRLTGPRVYVDSAYRNHEMIAVRAHLMAAPRRGEP